MDKKSYSSCLDIKITMNNGVSRKILLKKIFWLIFVSVNAIISGVCESFDINFSNKRIFLYSCEYLYVAKRIS